MFTTLPINAESITATSTAISKVIGIASTSATPNNVSTTLTILKELGISGLLGTIIGYCLPILRDLIKNKSNQKSLDEKRKYEVYANIMGLKITTTQLILSRFEALIHSDYHETKWKLTGNNPNSLDLEESKRWMLNSEQLVKEVTKNNQVLFKNLAAIYVLFPDNKTILNFVDNIYKFKTPVIKAKSSDLTLEQNEEWKTKAKEELQQMVDLEFGKPLSDLAHSIKQQLNNK